jgi:hypothetical protein
MTRKCVISLSEVYDCDTGECWGEAFCLLRLTFSHNEICSSEFFATTRFSFSSSTEFLVRIFQRLENSRSTRKFELELGIFDLLECVFSMVWYSVESRSVPYRNRTDCRLSHVIDDLLPLCKKFSAIWIRISMATHSASSSLTVCSHGDRPLTPV